VSLLRFFVRLPADIIALMTHKAVSRDTERITTDAFVFHDTCAAATRCNPNYFLSRVGPDRIGNQSDIFFTADSRYLHIKTKGLSMAGLLLPSNHKAAQASVATAATVAGIMSVLCCGRSSWRLFSRGCQRSRHQRIHMQKGVPSSAMSKTGWQPDNRETSWL
jgi:hypothetical protein